MGFPGSGREKTESRENRREVLRNGSPKKKNGRLRQCANDHYRIVAANPPRRVTQRSRRQAGSTQRSLRAEITW
jgi:hypothetical protein